jgi:hypothetical protein
MNVRRCIRSFSASSSKVRIHPPSRLSTETRVSMQLQPNNARILLTALGEASGDAGAWRR